MSSYQLIFPDYLTDYEHETESKGYLTGLKIIVANDEIELTVYDPTRLAQEIGDELHSSGYFTETRLLVVPKVTKEEISTAVEKMSVGTFRHLR